MVHVRARGGSAGGSGSYRDLLYLSLTTSWDSGMGDLCSSMEALTPSFTGPTYRCDAVYESIPHVCTGKRGGEYVP
jgi:hypothetical protein